MSSRDVVVDAKATLLLSTYYFLFSSNVLLASRREPIEYSTDSRPTVRSMRLFDRQLDKKEGEDSENESLDETDKKLVSDEWHRQKIRGS